MWAHGALASEFRSYVGSLFSRTQDWIQPLNKGHAKPPPFEEKRLERDGEGKNTFTG